ncbi:MAG: Flp pilus assembly complex ATPase component TadA, partial [Desulfobacula sp.]|nr:Flp pilus assembly complex ATPase component TadA [Desulfobacula sp.]
MYTQKYGLRQRPFENTPDPQFLFLSRIHREVLSSLIYGIQSSKGFILVSGDIGTGKTTLIHALLKEVQHSNIVLHIINPRTNFKEIISNLSQKLNIESKG